MKSTPRNLALLAPLLALVLAGSLGASFPDPPAVSATAPLPATSAHSERVVLAGGCFWGMEAVFEQLKGVSRVVAGYSGGAASTAHYEMVSTGTTGHAESVEITFDPAQISFGQILKVYFSVAHDPTELDRQGPDSGPQYRSSIFYTSAEQQRLAQAYIKELDAAKVFPNPIVTLVVPLKGFYAAEDYHQHFVARNPYYPYVVFNDEPKLKALRQQYPQLVASR
jgi:peptide-methionine (S)-S-oxide reductase